MNGPRRPAEYFDDGLQHERTSLAWERTSISMMVSGVLFARFAAVDAHWGVAILGLLFTVFGAAVLLWASVHYEDLHDELRAGEPIVHPGATRAVGIITVVASGLALVLALASLV